MEVASVGREGFVGWLHPWSRVSTLSGQIDIPGAAFVAHRETVDRMLESSPALQRSITLSLERQVIATAQLSACHRLHPLPQRLARWILMATDRTQNWLVPITQERLAEILGVRRPAVTLVASAFTRAGLIRCGRGTIAIEDRTGLKLEACECYDELSRILLEPLAR